MTSWADDPVKGKLVEDPSTVRALFPRLDPVNGGTLGVRVYSQLPAFLMVGGVPPGEKITLRELTRACGTSLMPVREAVQWLAAERALLPNRAIRVSWMTKSRIQEILRLRLSLEGMAVEEAAARIDDADLVELELLNGLLAEEMRRRGDSAASDDRCGAGTLSRQPS